MIVFLSMSFHCYQNLFAGSFLNCSAYLLLWLNLHGLPFSVKGIYLGTFKVVFHDLWPFRSAQFSDIYKALFLFAIAFLEFFKLKKNIILFHLKILEGYLFSSKNLDK